MVDIFGNLYEKKKMAVHDWFVIKNKMIWILFLDPWN